MKYDPTKKFLGKIVSENIFLRKLFYFLLDLMFLRSWYVKRDIRNLYPFGAKPDILDAGMGFGQYTYFMAKRFPQSNILALDVKEEQVKDCKYFFSKSNLDNVKFKIADLTQINFNEQFDFILCVDVMEHIEEDELVLRNYAQALRKGGKLLINTPSDLGGSDVHDEGDTSFIEEHARDGYSKDDITAKLNRSGFKLLSFKYGYGKFGTIAWRFGIKYPIMIAGKSKFLMVLLPFYYIFTLWWVLILMWLDLNTDNKGGTGITLVAEKI
ncbi:class I SAM-dependent methyltransferase [Ignavibacteria bacterium CHB1]|nr:MAG: class I SAM-dependent methyltransferase [Chlorobiota bacterium]MBV6399065.1 Ubiquinone biosynthesis O-methyltransferase [Ignavibacteria bacterium]MCC6885283.1 class I SAM-dependent methyltransferase [Ignavibacteriales bacterium]MCE7953315.1 class I SAM-dependent methyltransferase [Chlorobi bacterium CHB7]MDL1887268.1 class I SAM-dependent methyltransferase [Ignavibacteria bacterium CHB1]RIK48429.1 MAG: methyltransferase type 11 [Ignavibacteriota bacterium]